MKVLAQIIYSVIVILFLAVGDNSRGWGAVYLITGYLFNIVLLYYPESSRNKNSKFESVFKFHTIWLNLSITFYTLPCVYASKDWVKAVTPWFAVLLGLVFAAVLLYASTYKYTYELRKR